ncbi:hypothetical protein EDB85DRAFT_559520 [Lactarius pseudohatsudake]|nr:hypothetical protein EDB85DRAFT_559520 [Lactarius pseudohatsudake]
MPVPGEWTESVSPPGGSDAPPQPESLNNQRSNVKVMPRVYHPAENLPLRFWDHRRLAEHASAMMPLDNVPVAVDFILRNHITGSFLLNYTYEIDEIMLEQCELTRKIARTVPFWIPRRRARFTCERYCLPKLVEDLDANFSPHPPLVADEEVFDWEDETPSPSTLASDSCPNPDPAEGLLLSLAEHTELPEPETFPPLPIILPQPSLSQDIFTSPTLLKMGFRYDFSTAQMPAAHAIRRLTPVRSADDDGRSSGPEVLGERTSCRSEGGRRGCRTSAAVVPGCSFLCFGAGVLAPFWDLPRRLLVPRTFVFSPSRLIANIEDRRPGQAELGQSHVQ